jgi:hypothetical protein
MKTLMIIVNTAFVCYALHLLSTYDPLTVAINRAVLEAVMFN